MPKKQRKPLLGPRIVAFWSVRCADPGSDGRKWTRHWVMNQWRIDRFIEVELYRSDNAVHIMDETSGEVILSTLTLRELAHVTLHRKSIPFYSERHEL